MTDKERAEKYLYEIVAPKKIEVTVLNANREIKNAYIAGLKEGRKEVREHETTCVNRLHHVEKENAELKKKCDFNCPVHKLATHNTCLFCTAVRNSPYRDLKNVTDEELQKIIKEAEAEMEM